MARLTNDMSFCTIAQYRYHIMEYIDIASDLLKYK
jgi:hypothetical protein